MDDLTGPSGIPKTVGRYAATFECLTRDTVPDLLAFVTDDVVFTDPFNTVSGKEGFENVFLHMFETCEEPGFTITDIAEGRESWYLRWRMRARLKPWPRTRLDIEGMSEIRLDRNGLVSHHLDHWDSASQLLATLPFIGSVVRPVMRRFRIA